MHYNMLNEAMNCKVSTAPKAGMLGTMYVGSDRYTVVCSKVFSPKNIQVLKHFHPDFLKNRFTKDGIEYIPEEDLNALIYQATPNTAWYDKYDMTDEEKRETVEWDIKRFNNETKYSLRQNGRWMQKGASAHGTGSIHWGFGDEYLDPSF